MFAIKFNTQLIKESKLRELVKELRCSLIKDRMTKNEINDSTTCKRQGYKTSGKKISELIHGTSMSGRSIAKTIGAKSRTTAVRLMEEMVKKSEVAIIRRGGTTLIDICYSEQAFQHLKKRCPHLKHKLYWDKNSGAVYTCTANEYYICDRNETARFRHLIFNHDLRHRKQKQEVQANSSSQLSELSSSTTLQNQHQLSLFNYEFGWYGEDEETENMALFM